MTTLFLSRARLRRDASVCALWPLLAPNGRSAARVEASHRLVWSLFADAEERTRDFLWREAAPGTFYLLSARPPEDRHGLFELDPPKPFAPALAVGDRLAFSLRANATVARGGGPGRRGKPVDVVMDALYRVPKGEERATQRADAVQRAGCAWLARQGERAGFRVAAGGVRVLGHRVLRLARPGGEPARFGVLDLEGTLEVTDPAAFMAALGMGFGRAKAFGCGLMLIRRVGRGQG